MTPKDITAIILAVTIIVAFGKSGILFVLTFGGLGLVWGLAERRKSNG